jgi:aerobic-type carbon monoxide dehydrogenase small subunit (CoxS/CutS family)
MTVNGKRLGRSRTASSREFLRETLKLTGTHIGCDTSHAGRASSM